MAAWRKGKDKEGFFTDFEHDGLDAHVLGKGNVYDNLRQGQGLGDVICCRFVLVRPYLVVYARIGELARVLAVRPRFDECLCLLWNGEIQSVHAGRRHAGINDELCERLWTLWRLTCPDLYS